MCMYQTDQNRPRYLHVPMIYTNGDIYIGIFKSNILVYTKRQKGIYADRKHKTTQWYYKKSPIQ